MLSLLSVLQMGAQKTIDLSGDWNFEIDRQDIGEKEKWFNQALKDMIELPGSMPERLKGDDVTVCTRWTGSLYDSSYYYNPYMEKYRREGNVKLPFFLTPDKHYVGVAWYQKEINLPKDWKKDRIVLFLERPHIESTVWVNGHKVGMQNSLCVAHVYDVTQFMSPGKCRIAIRIDNRIKDINVGPDSHSITDQTQGNWNGIVGRIYLQTTPKVYLEDIQVYSEPEQKVARVKLLIKSSDKSTAIAQVKLSARSFNTEQRHVLPTVTHDVKVMNGIAEQEIVLPMGDDMLLWDEFNPALYKLTAEISTGKGKEVKEIQFGMRRFEIKGKWFYVNGRKTMLRGTVENCDFPLTGYAPMDVESWERVFRICRSYGLNHMRFHSFCMLACGNEPSGRWVDWVTKFVDYWENTDPRRVYTGASVGGGWQWQPRNQYHVKAGARGLTWRQKRPQTNDDYHMQSRIDTVSQPYVSHETGQWCVFPNFNEIRKYTGVNKARNFEIFRDILNDNQMGEQAHCFMMASGKLQTLCYKYEIEKTLRTPDYAGFQLLALNDYSGQGTALVGVLDVFFEEKGYINAQEWRRFCSPTVPLMRTDKFVYTNDEAFVADIEIAHFGEKALKHAPVTYTIKDVYGKVYTRNTLGNKDIPIGNLHALGHIEFPLGEIKKPTELNLEVRIEGTEAVNDWNFWVYPKEVELVQKDVYTTDTLDTKALDILQNGGKVLILAAGKVSYGKEVSQMFTPVFWNTSWFKMRPPHTTGILVNPKHPLFREFPTEYHSNLQWWELLNRAQVMQFTDFPADFQPTIQSIDTWFLSRKIGMLFEAKVLNGKLIMSTMDLTTNTDERIVARQMHKAILDYMNSDHFRPMYTIEPERISDLFKKVAGDVKSYTKGSPDELKPKIN